MVICKICGYGLFILAIGERKLYISTNGGTSWNLVDPSGTNKNIYSIAMSSTNKSPLLGEKRRKAAIKNLLNKPIISSLNISFKEALHDAGLCPLPEYPVGPYVVDFCFPDKKLIIEVDGDFWHANPDLYSHDKLIPIQQKTVNKDKREASFIENINWKLVRLWEKDINENISACIKKVQDLYEQKN
jgi:very-short-patch-repair endonuclease